MVWRIKGPQSPTWQWTIGKEFPTKEACEAFWRGLGFACPCPCEEVITRVGVNPKILSVTTDRPIQGATVNLGEEIRTTGSDGMCRFLVAPNASYQLKVSHPDYHEWTEIVPVDTETISPTVHMTLKTAPPPPPPLPPPPPPELAPPPAECDKVAWYDIPKGLHCLFKSIMALPASVGDFIMRKWVEYLWKRYVLTATAVMKRARSPGEWTSEEIKMVTGLDGVAPEIMTVNFIEGLLASFVSGPNKDRLMATMYERDQAKLPSPSDLVRMELREVFKPTERAEQIVPPPSQDFIEYMKPLGLDEWWARSYWAAHWDLPSVSEGYEMFARLRPDIYKPGTKQGDRVLEIAKSLGMDPGAYKPSFELGDLTKLMIRQDKMQRYIPQLAEIAYLPLTRVDVRRMYALGVLDETGVYNAYLDLHYSPENAERLRDFTKKYEAPEERRAKELSLTDQEKLFASGKRTEAQLKTWMDKTGYGPEAIKDELEILNLVGEKVEKVKRPKELSLTDWEKLLYESKLLWSEIKARMAEMGYSARAQKDELMIVQLEATKKWAAAYIARSITLEDLKKRLKTIELTDKEILELTAKLKIGA